MAGVSKMSGALRVGVIGLGFFGRRHARIYDAHPAAELVAVCDADGETLASVAAETGAEAHDSVQGLLTRGDLHAVSICLPDRLHEEAAVAAAAAVPAILLEKPLAHTAETAKRIVAAVEAAGTRLMIGRPAFRSALRPGVSRRGARAAG